MKQLFLFLQTGLGVLRYHMYSIGATLLLADK
jgi:hypothetical protein